MKGQGRGEVAQAGVLVKRRLRLLATICLLALVIPTFFSLFSFQRTFIIVSDSMAPTLNSGDLLLIHPVGGEIADGAIVVFKSPMGGFQSHRVIDKITIEGSLFYVTKGDANEKTDSFLLPEKNIIGALSLVIPRLGLYFLIPREIALITTLLLILAYMILTFKLSLSFSFKNLFNFKNLTRFFLHKENEKTEKGVMKAILLIVAIFLSSVLGVHPSLGLASSSVSLIYPSNSNTVSVTSPSVVL